jgi:hypothetical protein
MKKVIYVLPLFLLLLAGCGSKPATKEPVQDKGQEAREKAESKVEARQGSAKHSINSLLAANKPVECDYQEDSQESMSKMKFFLDASSKKMRGEGEIYDKKEGKQIKASWLMIGNDYYSWGEAMGNKGFKMTISDKQLAKGDDSGEEVNMDSEHEMDCRAWKVDNSKFSLPSGVSFSEIQQPAVPSQMTPSQTGIGTGAPSANNICSSCGLINDEDAKKACLENLNCN